MMFCYAPHISNVVVSGFKCIKIPMEVLAETITVMQVNEISE